MTRDEKFTQIALLMGAATLIVNADGDLVGSGQGSSCCGRTSLAIGPFPEPLESKFEETRDVDTTYPTSDPVAYVVGSPCRECTSRIFGIGVCRIVHYRKPVV